MEREPSLPIRPAGTEGELRQVRQLFLEYQEALGVDLCFQGFEAELRELPGAYAPPAGRLGLALDGSHAVGTVGLRPLGGGDCEMKRLYVRAGYRGLGLGRRLASWAIAEARRIGYLRLRLDTLPSMTEAGRLYRSMGFREIEAYTHNPVAGALFLELDLATAALPSDRPTGDAGGE